LFGDKHMKKPIGICLSNVRGEPPDTKTIHQEAHNFFMRDPNQSVCRIPEAAGMKK
jgi:hypothetical protein